MTLKNVGRFYADANATAITYKKYGNTVEGQYPTFSVCFEGNGFYRFNESAVFTAYGIQQIAYEGMLEGKQAFQYHYEPSSHSYSKHPLAPNFTLHNRFKGQDLFQLPDIIKKAVFVAENQSQSIFFGITDGISVEQIVEEPPFFISYQTLTRLCWTRQRDFTSDFIRRYDRLMLDDSSLDSKTRLKLFFHYPGQLLSSFDTPSVDDPVSSVRGRMVTLKVSQTTLLRKRSVKKHPCNKKIEDHDRFILESVSNDTACLPPYWRTIFGTKSSLKDCSSPVEFRKIHELTSNFQNIFEEYDTPCLGMFNSVTIGKNVIAITVNKKRINRISRRYNDWNLCKDCTTFEIVYLDKYYGEIKEIQDFGFEDFISSLGGFIGIFLGYSMFQIPQLLGRSADI